MTGMQPHSRNRLLQMLDRAHTSLAKGERRLRAQEARLVEQNRTGRVKAEAVKLFRNMRETQALMMRHVRLLESEIQADGEAVGPAVDDGTHPWLSKLRRLTENEPDLIASANSNLAESRELFERVNVLLLEPALPPQPMKVLIRFDHFPPLSGKVTKGSLRARLGRQ
jgi:hypothetical protein